MGSTEEACPIERKREIAELTLYANGEVTQSDCVPPSCTFLDYQRLVDLLIEDGSAQEIAEIFKKIYPTLTPEELQARGSDTLDILGWATVTKSWYRNALEKELAGKDVNTGIPIWNKSLENPIEARYRLSLQKECRKVLAGVPSKIKSSPYAEEWCKEVKEDTKWYENPWFRYSLVAGGVLIALTIAFGGDE